MHDVIRDGHRADFMMDERGYAERVSRQLDTRGIAVLEEFFTATGLEKMRKVVRDSHEHCLGGSARRHLTGGELDGTIFFDFAKSEFVQTLSNMVLRQFGYQVDRDDVYPVLNLLLGQKSTNAIRQYHFDATFLTLALPVIMPDTDSSRRGSFRIWPNVRRFSTNRLEEKLYWRLMRIPWLRDRFSAVTVDFKPGNLYLFYGFRSWHGIDDLDERFMRANCLINVGGPFFYLRKHRGRQQAAPEVRIPA
jgi:hypothetical protein